MASASTPSDLPLELAQTAWSQIDRADLMRHGGNPFAALFAREWGYTVTMRFEGRRPVYYASVYRHDADTCKNSRSTTSMGAACEAYVAALRRERLAVLN